MALTIIVATMEGAERKAEELAVMFGPTAVNVLGGDITGQSLGRKPMTLTWRDKRALEAGLPEVERVSPYLYLMGVSLRGNGKHHIAGMLGGSGEEFGLHWSWPIAHGRDFTVEDVRRSSRVCLLGAKTAEILFGRGEPLGSTVLIEDVPFLVIGVHSPIGMESDGVHLDDRVTVPISTMAHCFNMSRHHLMQMRVTFPQDTPENAMPQRVETVRAILREAHGFSAADADDFILFTAGDVLAFVSILKGGVVLFLGVTVVAAVLVSGFVLANLFHLSVAERGQEIGLKKALGAKRSSLLLQFLFEALLLCLCGAVIGLLGGLLVSSVLQRYGMLTIALSGLLFAAAFAGACVIGLCFALSPARRAANMQPIAALRGAEG
jgi:putative ABC transport system permease protein